MSLCSLGWLRTHIVAQVGLELMTQCSSPSSASSVLKLQAGASRPHALSLKYHFLHTTCLDYLLKSISLSIHISFVPNSSDLLDSVLQCRLHPIPLAVSLALSVRPYAVL